MRCSSMEGCKLQSTKLTPLVCLFLIANLLIKNQTGLVTSKSKSISLLLEILDSSSVGSVKDAFSYSSSIMQRSPHSLGAWDSALLSYSLNLFLILLYFHPPQFAPQWCLKIFTPLLKLVVPTAPGCAFLPSYPMTIIIISVVSCL